MYKNFNNYEVFADGRIWSKKSKKFLKPYTMKNGYQMVNLYDNEGKQHMQLVHRVTWIAVNGEIPEGMELNHIDENKCNNAIWNLQLCSHRDNINHGTRNSRAAKAQSKRVGAFKNGELQMIFASTQDAGRNGYKQGNVWACCRGERKTHKGFTWKYLD